MCADVGQCDQYVFSWPYYIISVIACCYIVFILCSDFITQGKEKNKSTIVISLTGRLNMCLRLFNKCKADS